MVRDRGFIVIGRSGADHCPGSCKVTAGVCRSVIVEWSIPRRVARERSKEFWRYRADNGQAKETREQRRTGAAVIKVRPRGNESIQQMLKRFKRLCQREGLTRDLKRHSYFEKPSVRKRRQSRKLARKAEKESAPPR